FTIGLNYRAGVDYPRKWVAGFPFATGAGPTTLAASRQARRHPRCNDKRHATHDHDILRRLEHRATSAGLSAILRQARRPGAATDRRDGAPQRLGSHLA